MVEKTFESHEEQPLVEVSREYEHYYTLPDTGEKHGIYRAWDVVGNLKEIREYNNGIPEGSHKTYKNGKLIASISYKNGKKHGECSYFDSYQNRIEQIERYKEGHLHGLQETFYCVTGDPKESVEYDNGLRHGYHIKWNLCDAIVYKRKYHNGSLDGEFLAGYENGNIKQRGFFKNGEFHGEYIHYSIDGRVIAHAVYDNGKELNVTVPVTGEDVTAFALTHGIVDFFERPKPKVEKVAKTPIANAGTKFNIFKPWTW